VTIAMKLQPEPLAQEVLAGLVERVTYHNAENGFCVLRAKARGHRDVVTVVGYSATITHFTKGNWMPFQTSLAGLMVNEAVLSGRPLTNIEAEIYFGYSDLPRQVTRLRRSSLAVESREVPLTEVAARIEKTIGAPLPLGLGVKVRLDIGQKVTVTEYYYYYPGERLDAERQAKARARAAADFYAALAQHGISKEEFAAALKVSVETLPAAP
jgi:hypothetical protein